MSGADVRAGKCFACGKALGKRGGFLVDTRDGQEVFVGPECLNYVRAGGDAGYQPPKGGPRLWPLSAAGVLADMKRCAEDLGGEASEVLMQARAAVAELIEANRKIVAIYGPLSASMRIGSERREAWRELFAALANVGGDA